MNVALSWTRRLPSGSKMLQRRALDTPNISRRRPPIRERNNSSSSALAHAAKYLPQPYLNGNATNLHNAKAVVGISAVLGSTMCPLLLDPCCPSLQLLFCARDGENRTCRDGFPSFSWLPLVEETRESTLQTAERAVVIHRPKSWKVGGRATRYHHTKSLSTHTVFSLHALWREQERPPKRRKNYRLCNLEHEQDPG